MSGVLQFIWHYIDVVENGVSFLAHPIYAVSLTNETFKLWIFFSFSVYIIRYLQFELGSDY